MPGEPFCPACHASDDEPCSAEHRAWAEQGCAELAREIRADTCGFCHKPREGVRTMIELTGVPMCDECARQAYEMCSPPDPTVACAGCGKPRQNARALVEMMPGAAFCDECIETAHDVVVVAKQCAAEGCTNEGRYDSGYCGICDIKHNDGKGKLR